jgi:hypothetical protein
MSARPLSALVTFAVPLAITLVAACSPGSAPGGAPGTAEPAATADPALMPRISINQLMVAVVDNAAHILWDVEREGMAPKDSSDWLEIENHAIQLAAAATLIQVGGTGQADMGWIRQVGWRDHADMMGGAAVAALEAARNRDLAALVKANGDLVASCETCHKAFKPELPSEGLLHQRPHSDSHAPSR